MDTLYPKKGKYVSTKFSYPRVCPRGVGCHMYTPSVEKDPDEWYTPVKGRA